MGKTKLNNDALFLLKIHLMIPVINYFASNERRIWYNLNPQNKFAFK